MGFIHKTVSSTKQTLPHNPLILFSLHQPILENKLKIQDTCGVHNLHGMPGVMGAIVGAVTASLATKEIYGDG